MTTHYIYNDAGHLIGTYAGPSAPENSTTLVPVHVEGFTPRFVDGAWTQYSHGIKVSPVEFKLLFTPAERVAINARRTTDPVVDDFFTILDDPRLTHVNLGLPSTGQALAYLVSLGDLTANRPAEILTGVLK